MCSAIVEVATWSCCGKTAGARHGGNTMVYTMVVVPEPASADQAEEVL